MTRRREVSGSSCRRQSAGRTILKLFPGVECSPGKPPSEKAITDLAQRKRPSPATATGAIAMIRTILVAFTALCIASGAFAQAELAPLRNQGVRGAIPNRYIVV